MLKLCRVTKVTVFFLLLIYVFNFDILEFSAAVLEKGLSSIGQLSYMHVHFADYPIMKNSGSQSNCFVKHFSWQIGPLHTLPGYYEVAAGKRSISRKVSFKSSVCSVV